MHWMPCVSSQIYRIYAKHSFEMITVSSWWNATAIFWRLEAISLPYRTNFKIHPCGRTILTCWNFWFPRASAIQLSHVRLHTRLYFGWIMRSCELLQQLQLLSRGGSRWVGISFFVCFSFWTPGWRFSNCYWLGVDGELISDRYFYSVRGF